MEGRLVLVYDNWRAVKVCEELAWVEGGLIVKDQCS
jgi:hypothetical protein